MFGILFGGTSRRYNLQKIMNAVEFMPRVLAKDKKGVAEHFSRLPNFPDLNGLQENFLCR